jgi:hypothetical protein
MQKHANKGCVFCLSYYETQIFSIPKVRRGEQVYEQMKLSSTLFLKS